MSPIGRWYGLAPVAGTVTVATLWGTSGVLVRYLDLTAAQIACARASIGALALAAWLLTPFGRASWRRPAGWPALTVSGVLLAVHWWTFILALQRIPIGTVLLGIYLAPLVIAAAARPALGERVTTRQVVALGIALAGSVLILRPQQTGGWSGATLIGFSALAYAGSILASKRALAGTPPLTVTAIQLGLVGVLLAPAALLDPVALTAGDLFLLGVLGVVYSAAAQLVYLWGLRSLSATTSGTLLYLEPVSALVAGAVFLAEELTPATVLGAALVIVAGVLVTINTMSARGDQKPVTRRLL
ncbi:DMT family transporter [Micromonospora sp. NPDC004704]